MTSAKKGKLLITLVVFALICVLVPVIIAATVKQDSTIKSQVVFNLQDIEGKFGYGIYGAANSDNTGGVFQPTLFFQSAYNESTSTIEVQDADGNFFTSNQFTLDLGNLELNEHNRTKNVDLYFFFVNTADFEGYNNRTITLSFEDNSDFKEFADTSTEPGLSSAWSYTIIQSKEDGFVDFEDEMFQFGLYNWQPLNINNSIDVEPKVIGGVNTGTYSMAVVKYTLILDPEWDIQKSFGQDSATQPIIDITINFESHSVSN